MALVEKFKRRISSNSIVLIGYLVNLFHMLKTNFVVEEFSNACEKTLFESLVYWESVYHINVQFQFVLCYSIASKNVYTCFIKPAICFYISYLNMDTRLHTCSRSM